jgi:type I restriction enzyme S subunit
MSTQLPSGWAISRLGDLSTAIQYGYTQKAQQDEVGPRFLRITDIQDDKVHWDTVPFCAIGEHESEKYLLRNGDLVFARTGATVGKSFLISGEIPESVFASYLIRVRLRPDIEPKYVSYFFRSSDYWRQISESQAGIGQPNVNGKKLAQIQVPVAPFEQQKRIVAEIEKQFSRLDEAVVNLKRVKANLKRYKAAVLKAAVEGRLVETEAELARRAAQGSANVAGGRMPGATEGRSYETGEQLLQRILETCRSQWQGKRKYKEPVAPDTTDLPELPEGWVWACGAQFFEWSSGEGLTEKNQRLGPYPVYGGNGVSGHHDEYFVEKPTIVVGRVGAHCGNVYVTESKSWITDNAIYAKSSPSDVPLEYLKIVFEQAGLNDIAGGSGQPFVNQRMLNDVSVPLPPVDEQLRILGEVDRHLSLLRETEAQVDTNLQRAEHLRQAILTRAFSGDLVLSDEERAA